LPALLLALPIGVAGAVAAIAGGLVTKYLVLAVLGVGFVGSLALSGNPRLFLFCVLLFVAPLQVGKNFFYLGHVGGASSFDVTIVDPFLLMLFALQVRDRLQHLAAPARWPAVLTPWVALMSLGGIDLLTENYQTPVAHELWRMTRTLLWVFVIANEVVRRQQFLLSGLVLVAAMLFHALVALVKDVLGMQLGLENYGELTADAIENLGESAIVGMAGVRRVSGLLNHPILLGAYLATGIAVGFSLLFTPLRVLLRLLVGAAVGVGCITLLWTASRAAWLQLAVVIALVLCLTYVHPRARSRYFLVRVAIVACALAVVGAASGQIVARLTRSGGHSAESRWEFVETAMKMVGERPVFGFGLNNFVFDQPPYTPYGNVYGMTKKYGEFHWWPVVHSTWLIVWSEQGTLGLLVFLWLHVKVIRAGIRNFRIRDPTLNALGVGLLCAFVAIMLEGATSYFLRTQSALAVWSLVALIVALDHWRVANEEGSVAPPRGPPDRRARWLPDVGRRLLRP
jgi:O-antigen ligase